MKTVREIATELNISVQAVYKELKKQGIKTVRNNNRIELTEEQAESVLQAFIDRNKQDLKPELDRLKEENKRLNNRISELQDEITGLKAERESLLEDNRMQLRTIASQAEAIRVQAVAEQQKVQALEEKPHRKRLFFRRQ